MPSYRINGMAVTIDKEGADSHTKATFPIRVGKYSEIKTRDYEFHFNLKGQIKFIRGLHYKWRHPGELLKRTDGNDWVYYSLGSVGERIVRWLGEYYLPCPPYATNAIYEYNPFNDPNVMSALGAWSQLYANLYQTKRDELPDEVGVFFDKIRDNDETTLFKQAEALQAIIGERMSVLPPDTRHVDYEVIPLTLADGCRYHCGFCCVKSPQAYRPRTEENIREQIARLKDFYGPNLANYKALFLGNHDALGAGRELILSSASRAIKAFETKEPVLFLFGSVDSLLEADSALWDGLSRIADYTYINIGFESVDAATLAQIKKPLDADKVRTAFQKMLQINRDYKNIEITGNFLLGDMLSPEHNQALIELLNSVPEADSRKGAIYISPLLESQQKRELLDTFFQIKEQSALPAYVYLIQRL